MAAAGTENPTPDHKKVCQEDNRDSQSIGYFCGKTGSHKHFQESHLSDQRYEISNGVAPEESRPRLSSAEDKAEINRKTQGNSAHVADRRCQRIVNA